jgi:hypothetical protein
MVYLRSSKRRFGAMGTILKDELEIKPLLEKILPKSLLKNTAGSKIKTLRIQQIMNELQIVNPLKLIAFYQTTRHGFI